MKRTFQEPSKTSILPSNRHVFNIKSRRWAVKLDSNIKDALIVTDRNFPFSVSPFFPIALLLSSPKAKQRQRSNENSNNSSWRRPNASRQTVHIKGRSNQSHRRWFGRAEGISWQIFTKSIRVGRQFEVSLLIQQPKGGWERRFSRLTDS